MFFSFFKWIATVPFVCLFPASVRVKAQWLDPMVYYWLVFLMGCFLLEISLHGWYRYMLYVGYYRIKLDKTASMQLWVQDQSVERSSTDRIWPLWTKASWKPTSSCHEMSVLKREKQTSKQNRHNGEFSMIICHPCIQMNLEKTETIPVFLIYWTEQPSGCMDQHVRWTPGFDYIFPFLDGFELSIIT